MQKTRPWAILAAGAAIQVLTGLPAAWGVFQRPVMEEYGLSEQGAGYAFGVLIAFFGIGCVIGGFLQDKHGLSLKHISDPTRRLVIAYAVIGL